MTETRTNEERKEREAVFEFELEMDEFPIKLKSKETGQWDEYVLVELDGKLRDKYLNNLGGRIRTGPQGSSTLRNFEGLQSNLITRCLWKIVGADREAVDEPTIQSWPARVQTKLYDKCREMSGLTDEKDNKEDDQGND